MKRPRRPPAALSRREVSRGGVKAEEITVEEKPHLDPHGDALHERVDDSVSPSHRLEPTKTVTMRIQRVAFRISRRNVSYATTPSSSHSTASRVDSSPRARFAPSGACSPRRKRPSRSRVA